MKAPARSPRFLLASETKTALRFLAIASVASAVLVGLAHLAAAHL